MKNNKFILFLIIAISMMIPTSLIAQNTEVQTVSSKKDSFFKTSNITYGGNFGFHIDSYEYDILLMPEIGYKLFPRWKFALAPLYSYTGTWNSHGRNDEHILGLRVSTSIDLLNTSSKFNIFIYAGYQYEHHWLSNGTNQYDANYVDTGLGAKYRLSQNASAYLLAYWHAYAQGYDKLDGKSWFPDAIPSITFGIEIN
jgi:hypothetical protein